MANPHPLRPIIVDADGSSGAFEPFESPGTNGALQDPSGSTTDGQRPPADGSPDSWRSWTYIPLQSTGTTRRATPGPEDSSGSALVRTVPEAASLLGVSRALGYKLVREGTLRHIRLGRRIVVPYKAIQELLDGPRTDLQ
jgi:excisionase family DNA binding protein